MTQMILFDGNFYNPDLIWKISRVTNTVTLTIVLSGLPAGSAFSEDHVFGSEAEAITALDDFITEINAIRLNDLIASVADGIMSNSDLTKGFEKTLGISLVEKGIALGNFVLEVATVIKARADA